MLNFSKDRRLILVLALALGASGILLSILPEVQRTLLGAFLYMAYSGVASSFFFFSFLYYGIESVQGKALFGGFVAFAITSLSAGTILLTEFAGGKYSPGMNISDILGALAYPALFFSLFFALSLFLPLSMKKGAYYYAIWSVIAVSAALLLIFPIYSDSGIPEGDKFFLVAYVIGDLVGLLVATIFIANFNGSEINFPWVLIAGGAILIAGGDFAFGYLSWKGLYRPGHITNLLWFGGCSLTIWGCHILSRIAEEAEKTKEPFL